MAKMRKRNRANLQKSVKKKALIIGITGQDGINLSHLLFKKKYLILGTTRNLQKAKRNFTKNKYLKKTRLFKENFYSFKNTEKFLLKHKPNYIFFLGGQSSVGKSFNKPEETIVSNIIPISNILEVSRKFNLKNKIYNSSSSEIFGNQGKKKLNENSVYYPISPYGLAKAISTDLVKSYRLSFKIKCCNGICFNHESEQRNTNFLFGKLLKLTKNLKNKKKFVFGNLNIVRDWGLSKEYVEAYFKILNQKKLEDFIIATGKSFSIKQIFIKILGKKIFKEKIIFDKKLKRMNEIFYSYADPRKIRTKLGWKANLTVIDLFKKYG